MCGIIGVFDTTSSCPLPEEAVQEGMARMRLRGPDEEGLYRGRGVLLGHRRLSVIDPSQGQQPFTDPDTGVTIVFNGEIYNYKSLRQDLLTQGLVFRTQSDTEVLLKAYLCWDTGCLKRLRGMFALGIYDPRREQLFLARDRLGIKPLFYSLHRGLVMFASSIPLFARFLR